MQEVLQGRAPTMGDIDELPYCTAVVLETLRQHPPAYMIGRCACEDAVLGTSGYAVTKGTTALIAPYLLHYNPQQWDNPGTFNPKRWFRRKDGAEEVNWRAELKGFGVNSSYLPFGGGPRVCIGTTFAFVEAVLVVAMVLQHFSLAPAGQGQRFPQPQPLITLRPATVRVRINRRMQQPAQPVAAKGASFQAVCV
jgi:cytochrome P450